MLPGLPRCGGAGRREPAARTTVRPSVPAVAIQQVASTQPAKGLSNTAVFHFTFAFKFCFSCALFCLVSVMRYVLPLFRKQELLYALVTNYFVFYFHLLVIHFMKFLCFSCSVISVLDRHFCLLVFVILKISTFHNYCLNINALTKNDSTTLVRNLHDKLRTTLKLH
jgi:hypothetical protein